jgi:hypothetical protein
MTGKNYYLILGVSRSESLAGIRSRYRDLVRTLHPDVAGAQSTSAFREVIEAYEVLADPVTRRRHNNELAAREGHSPVDPATPVAPWRETAVTLLAEPQTVQPSFEALVERLVRNFTGLGARKGERPEGLTFEVILTPDEALWGGVVPVGVPGVRRCPDCGGTGRMWLFPCVPCGAEGVIPTEQVIRMWIPPRVPSGSVIEVPLDGFGIQNLYLRLHVRIG